jgi:hypothetical protein
MRLLRTQTSIQLNPSADRRFLFHGLTLIALGLSILFLNSWDSLFVRASVGLFWGAFFLILNWSDLVSALRSLKQSNGLRRRSIERSSVQR